LVGGSRVGPSGWRPAAILTAVVLVDSIDQGLVPGTLSLLQDDWGFSDTLGGAIPTAALVVGFCALVPAGWMADHLRRVRVLTLVVASWAALTVLSGLAVSFWTFFVVRMALGGASHVDNPVSSSLLADFYPPLARGRVFAVQRLSFVVGTGVGIGIGGLVGEWLGWRAAFLVVVIPGLVVAALVATLHEPVRGALDRPDLLDQHHGLDAHDAAQTVRAEAEPPAALLDEIDDTAPRLGAGGVRAYLGDFRGTLRIRTVRTIYFGLTMTVLGFNGIAYWLPTYLERDFDLSEGGAAVITGVVAITAGLLGAVLGGALGDRVEATRVGARVRLTGLSLFVGSALVLLGFSLEALPTTAVVVGLGATLLSFAFPNLAAAAADVLPARRRGTGFAMFGFLLTLGSALGPLVIGAISEATGSLQLAILLAVFPAIPGSLVVLGGYATFATDAATARAS
jgi:MFS family permease